MIYTSGYFIAFLGLIVNFVKQNKGALTHQIN